MEQNDEQTKRLLLERDSESSDSTEYHVERELHQPPISWLRRNCLSLAILCLMMYVAVLETIQITRQSVHPDEAGRLFDDDQPSESISLGAATATHTRP